MQAPLVSDSREQLRQASDLVRNAAKAQRLMKQAQAEKSLLNVVHVWCRTFATYLKRWFKEMPCLMLCAVVFGLGAVLHQLHEFRGAVDKQPTVRPYASALPVAPRALLVAPRAVLVGLPPGTYTEVTLPNDNQRLWITFRGHVATFSALPAHPQIGDTYTVTEGPGASWVWAQPLGWNHAAWVDP